MKNGKQANDGGGSAASSEAVADASESVVEDGSVKSLDEYLADKDAGPGVSQHSEAEEEVEESEETEAEEAEDSTTEDAEDTEEDESDSEDEESEEDDAEDDEHDGLGLNDDQKKGVGEIINRKVGKQVAKRKAAEEQLEASEAKIAELEAELEQAGEPPAVQAGTTSSNSIMLLESEAEVDQVEVDTRAMQKQAKRWLRRHDREDVLRVPQGDGEDAEYTYDQIEDRLDELEDVLSDTIPKARKQVSVRKAAAAKAKTAYPQLFDRKSEGYQAMRRILRAAPQLKALPDYQLMIGRMLAGEAAEGKPKAKSRKAAPPKPRAAKPPETSASNKAKAPARRYGQVNAKARTLGEYLDV